MSLQCTLLTTSSSTGRHQNPFLVVHHPLGSGISRSSHPSQKKFMCLHAKYGADYASFKSGQKSGISQICIGMSRCPGKQISGFKHSHISRYARRLDHTKRPNTLSGYAKKAVCNPMQPTDVSKWLQKYLHLCTTLPPLFLQSQIACQPTARKRWMLACGIRYWLFMFGCFCWAWLIAL